MAQANSTGIDSPLKRSGLLRDQIQLVKEDDSELYEIVPIPDSLSFEKGLYAVLRACQLLAEKNDGIMFVGIAGPSGAGKSVFTEKLLRLMPSIAVIAMDDYINSSQIIDGNFDDPHLTDYVTLLENLHGLKEGKAVQVPIYDFKTSSRTGYRTVEVPVSCIVIIEGIYALSENLRGMLDLRVSVTGGLHFDLVKRVLWDIQLDGQDPEEATQQISETLYPMYKAYIKPDLQTAHIRITNKFNHFNGFQNPIYTLKSAKEVTDDQIKAVLPDSCSETWEETYEIYLLPPGEDTEACRSYLRMRYRDGKYNLMFQEWITDSPFVIFPRMTLRVSFHLLGGLIALGYTIASILKRRSHGFFTNRICIKTDWFDQINRQYVQVQGTERRYVKRVAEQLGLDGSYVPQTYEEQMQSEKLMDDVMALPDDLKTKLGIDDNAASSPKTALSRAFADRRLEYLNRISQSHSNERDKRLSKSSELAVSTRRFDVNQSVFAQLSDRITTLNEKMNEFTARVGKLNSKSIARDASTSQQNRAAQAEVGSEKKEPTGAAQMQRSSLASSQSAGESSAMEQIMFIARAQRQIIHRLDNLLSLLHRYEGSEARRARRDGTAPAAAESSSYAIAVPLTVTFAVWGLSVYLFKTLATRK